jgi:hypothetical protein
MLLTLVFNVLDIIRRGLVYEVIQPVSKEQGGVAAPGGEGLLRIVVAREIVLGDLRIDARQLVTGVFFIKSIGIVFRMTCKEDLTSLAGGNSINACLLGGGKYSEIPNCLNVGSVYGGVSRMRNVENVIKTAEKNGSLVVNNVGINARKLLGEGLFLYSIVVVESCLRAPTNVKGGMNVGLGPLHNLAKLIPIVNLLKLHLLHRRACDDHTVKIAVAYLGELLIKGKEMLLGNVF